MGKRNTEDDRLQITYGEAAKSILALVSLYVLTWDEEADFDSLEKQIVYLMERAKPVRYETVTTSDYIVPPEGDK